MLTLRMEGKDLTRDEKVTRFYHIATMSLSPYQPFLREMDFVEHNADNDWILLQARSSANTNMLFQRPYIRIL